MTPRDDSPGWNDLREDWFLPLDRGLLSRDLEVSRLRWFSDGRSGAPVGLVQLYRSPEQHFFGDVVMKFVALGDSKDPTEPYRRIFQEAPESFRHAHLTEMVGDIGGPISLPNHDVIFQQIAGQNMSGARPLAEVAGRQDFADLCGRIATSLVADWNVKLPHRPTNSTVGQFLHLHVHDRLEWLLNWAIEQNVSPSTPWLPTGRPNPFSLFHPSRADTPLNSVFRGYAHGDIGLRNIIVTAEPAGYLLIDYDRYRNDAPLTRDPVNLLISMAAERLGSYTVGAPSRESLIQVLVDPDASGTPEVTGFAGISRAIRDGARRWADEKRVRDAWEEQTLLSVVGSALRALARGTEGPDVTAYRAWCLRLASVAAGRFLGVPDDAASPRVPAHGATRATVGGRTPVTAGQRHPTRAADAHNLLISLAKAVNDLSANPSNEERLRLCDDASANAARLRALLRELVVKPENRQRLGEVTRRVDDFTESLADLRVPGRHTATDRAVAQINELLDTASPLLF